MTPTPAPAPAPAPVQVDIRPIIDPILALLRSRGVMVAFFSLVLVLITVYVPNVDPRVTTAVEILGGAIIAKIGIEDAAAKFAAGRAP